MADKDTLWTAVKTGYSVALLIPLTAPHNRAITALGADQDTVGTAAAQQCIDYFPLYGEVNYNASDSQHVAVAVRGTIVVLMERGGVGSEQAKKEWDEVFGGSGILSRIRKTGSRGRQGPKTNSNLTQSTGLSSSGQRKRPWSDRESFPIGTMPRDTIAGR